MLNTHCQAIIIRIRHRREATNNIYLRCLNESQLPDLDFSLSQCIFFIMNSTVYVACYVLSCLSYIYSIQCLSYNMFVINVSHIIIYVICFSPNTMYITGRLHLIYYNTSERLSKVAVLNAYWNIFANHLGSNMIFMLILFRCSSETTYFYTLK